jgi:hypothetical protein
MKAISRWAKYHPHSAQALIVMIYILMNIAGLNAGRLLMEIGIVFSSHIEEIALALILILAVIYHRKKTYNYRKAVDFSLAITTFVLICCWGNQKGFNSDSLLFSSNKSYGNTYHKSSENIRQHQSNLNFNKKDIRKTIHQLYKKPGKGNSDWIKVAQITLVILTGIGLGILLAALACNIACSGAEGLAYLVAIVGYAGIIAGCYFLIRKIIRNPVPQTEPEISDTNDEK